MDEDTHTCLIHKKYYGIECANPALPGDPEGLCILHSQNYAKDPEVFKEALRFRWAQEDATFYDFRGVFFLGLFDPLNSFGKREFTKPVNFSRAVFTGRGGFYLGQFYGGRFFHSNL